MMVIAVVAGNFLQHFGQIATTYGLQTKSADTPVATAKLLWTGRYGTQRVQMSCVCVCHRCPVMSCTAAAVDAI